MNDTGNGASSPIERQLQSLRSLEDHGRRIHHDAATLAAELRGTATDLERYLTDQVKRRSYSTLGVVAGIGYVLGGGLRSRLTVVLLGAATRLVAALAVRELGARILPDDSTSIQDKRRPSTAREKQRSDHEY
jgi:hypothetical protein